jgi:UDPglucose 6-dehydrogenase
MKLIVAGYGFVGKAVANTFKTAHDLVIVDPVHSTDTISENTDAYGIIICVPTPQTDEHDCDISSIRNVLDQVPIYMPVLIKSTVIPSAVDIIKNAYPNHSIVYSPEFLRARSADQDFLNQKYIILGGDDPEQFWHDVFLKALPNCKVVFNCTEQEACLVKYASNSFLALKTSYFNQIYDVCQTHDMSFDVVRHLITMDTRIGADHTIVPGPDMQRGWGGHCFPKDTNAFANWTSSIGKPVTLVESAINYNKKVRKTT